MHLSCICFVPGRFFHRSPQGQYKEKGDSFQNPQEYQIGIYNKPYFTY